MSSGFLWIFFDRTVKVALGKGRAKKYPKIGYDYEWAGNPGLFVVGTASHSLDFRKSAGGFIHGFRYTGEYCTVIQVRTVSIYM